MTQAEIIRELWIALAFYADPNSYFAVLIQGDHHCGAFAYDVSEIEDELRHGHLARETLEKLLPEVDKIEELRDQFLEKDNQETDRMPLEGPKVG